MTRKTMMVRCTKMGNKKMSNSQAINLFKKIEVIRCNTNLSRDEISRKINSIHNKLIIELDHLVHVHTKMYINYPNYEDLIQEGYIGLLKAVRKFNYTRFPNFFVYASQWIRHSIKRAASRFDVVYSPNKERVIYAEPAELGIEEVDDYTLENTLLSKEVAKQINLVLNDFPHRDREIVKRIFGLDGFNPQTLRDVGPIYNITYERVRQIKNNVVSKLREDQRMRKLG